MTVTCNIPQKYTEVIPGIQKIEKNKEVVAHQFQVIRRVPEIKYPNVVVIQDLYIKCFKGVWDAYKGEAKGYVYLESGKKLTVKGDSGKFVAVECLLGAQ